MSTSEDPGWRPALRRPWLLLVPFIPIIGLRRTHVDIVAIRRIFLHACIGLVEVAVAVPPALEGAEGGRTIPVILLLAEMAGAAAGFVWIGRTPLASTSADALAGQFRSLFFIRLAFALSPGVAGIAGAYLVGRFEPAVVGTAASLLYLAWMAPTRDHIDRLDEALRVSGSSLSLIQALAGEPGRAS